MDPACFVGSSGDLSVNWEQQCNKQQLNDVTPLLMVHFGSQRNLKMMRRGKARKKDKNIRGNGDAVIYRYLEKWLLKIDSSII